MHRPEIETNPHIGGFQLSPRTLLVAALSLCATGAAAQSSPNPANSRGAQPTRQIVVSFPDRKLALLEDDRVIKIYDVAVGAPVSPSPSGEFQIVQRLERPTYYKPGVVIGPGVENPLGTRWIGLSVKGLGIHGTNRPDSVGKNASHGCIRLRNRDVEDLFARVKVGDRVSFIAERTDEVTRLFGGAPDPETASATMLASNEQNTAHESEVRGDL